MKRFVRVLTIGAIGAFAWCGAALANETTAYYRRQDFIFRVPAEA